jgi:formylglycine-generating enzyme required for sulfatase activity
MRKRRRGLLTAVGVAVVLVLALLGRLERTSLKLPWRSYRLAESGPKAQPARHVLTAKEERALRPGDSFQECAVGCPVMIVVPAGRFMMGSPASGQAFEQPQHKVTIAQPFALAEYETTFAEWDACAAAGACNPQIKDSGFGRGRQPVINLTWNDAAHYAAWLAKLTGKPYRLPSETEYEYAARAGTQTTYPWGDAIGKNNANCNGCGSHWDDMATAPVGSFPPNRFGLFDMVGNVYEWVLDCLHANYDGAPSDGSAWTEGDACFGHMIRGGSWADDPVDLHSASRTWSPATIRRSFIGFRVARSLAAR